MKYMTKSMILSVSEKVIYCSMLSSFPACHEIIKCMITVKYEDEDFLRSCYLSLVE